MPYQDEEINIMCQKTTHKKMGGKREKKLTQQYLDRAMF